MCDCLMCACCLFGIQRWTASWLTTGSHGGRAVHGAVSELAGALGESSERRRTAAGHAPSPSRRASATVPGASSPALTAASKCKVLPAPPSAVYQCARWLIEIIGIHARFFDLLPHRRLMSAITR